MPHAIIFALPMLQDHGSAHILSMGTDTLLFLDSQTLNHDPYSLLQS